MKPTTKVVATSVVAASISAAIISSVTSFTARHEGTDLVAKYDMIGTGHPLTWCHGQTPTDDKTVKPGQRFTPAQCDAFLAKSLPKYLAPLQKCITRPAPIKVIGATLDAAYNAGPTAVCKSPIVALINKGDFRGACNAFTGWYIRASGRVVHGLINRRADEKRFCMEGVTEGLPKPVAAYVVKPWWQRVSAALAIWTHKEI